MNKLTLAAITALFVAFLIFVLSLPTSAKHSLPILSPSQLAHFNGTDPHVPIYLALDSFIYDVSTSREYYAPKGPYHDLAGTDCSNSLSSDRRETIKSRYPVVAVLE